MRILVQKFGGTSVANRDAMQHVLHHIKRALAQGYKVVAVLSAMAGETNRLIALAYSYSKKPLPVEFDTLLSTGEQVSVALFTMLAHDAGIKVRSFNASQIPIYTSDASTCARIESIDTGTIRRAFEAYDLLVVTGFQGITRTGNITTLGRGGSDTTAVAIAAALDSAPCEIYTDVDGIYTTDPNMCPAAKKLDCITYDEILEMASMGAKVLQTRSVLFAKRYMVPLYVRSTFSDDKGTFLIQEEDIMESSPISGVVYDRDQVSISVVSKNTQILVLLFKALAQHDVIVDMIIQNPQKEGMCVAFSVAQSFLDTVLSIVEGLRETLQIQTLEQHVDLAKISVIGFGMKDHSGIAATMFATLEAEGIPITLINTSEIKISCLIPAKYTELAVRSLHEAFFADVKK